MSRWPICLCLVVLTGCPWPDPEPLDEALPGFAPCRSSHLEDVLYDVCPEDAGFPYGEWVAGVVEGNPAVYSEPSQVVLHADGADWTLSAIGHYSVAFAGDSWSDDVLADAPPIELTVSAPCGSPDHWFAVRSASSGFLIVAAGNAATATVDDWTVDATVEGDTCPDPVDDCPCSEQCTVDPIRFSSTATDVDLYPSEQSEVPGAHQLMTFERWTAEGESTCEDGRTEGQRWLIVGDED